jgi:hypothetical protein
LKETGQPKLSYIGHSLGCGTFFIAMVKNPELNSKIEMMVGIDLKKMKSFPENIRIHRELFTHRWLWLRFHPLLISLQPCSAF